MANEERSGTTSKTTTKPTTGAAPKANGNQRSAKPAAKPTPPGAAASGSTVPPRRAERRSEMIQKRREERLSQYERRKKEWLYTRIGLGAIAALVLIGIGYGAFTAYDNWREEQDLEGVVDFDYVGNEHSAPGETLTWTESPPVGGRHDPAWQNCGFYAQPIRSEHAVHSMEHGAVWITYSPDLPQEDIAVLQSKADGESHVLVSPYQNLQAPVVVQSWGHQLVLDDVDDDRLDTFIRVYMLASDVPEPGALCSGNVSTTA